MQERISMQEIGEDSTALRIVSPAYAGKASEMTAVLQYVYQSIVLGDCGRVEESKVLMKIAVDEMRHLEILGTLICRLGAPPVFTSCPPYPVGYYSASFVDYTVNPQKMIERDLAGERAAIAQYGQMLCKLKNERVRAVISHIIGEEEKHVEQLKELAKAL